MDESDLTGEYDFSKYRDALDVNFTKPVQTSTGRVKRVIGLTVEAVGLSAPIGAQCVIESSGENGPVDAEVIGFDGELIFLMPFENIEGVSPGAGVTIKSTTPLGGFSWELRGRVIDGLGQPIDDGEPLKYTESVSLEGRRVGALERRNITEVLDTGVKAINSCFTFGKGQRMGLIAGSGVGKSVLLAMLTKNTSADIVVIALIGERSREVKEFVTETLGVNGLQRAVIVAESVSSSAVRRIKAAKLAHTIAEQYRMQGKHVLLLVDSLTRVAHAQREIGLAVGEPPTTKGYPPSVFALLPSLIERVGMGGGSEGSISAFYTVLAENDDRADPIVDISRATLDGQIMLSRKLADSAHYPAIDLEGSISRVADKIVPKGQIETARYIRRLWALYYQNEDIIQIGAYESGSNSEIDLAIERKLEIDEFLTQGIDEIFSVEETSQLLEKIL
ncbi:FliI/YscN family ATPase [Gammaproteobacteria bacterium]|jgi:flagellum-specific ATP synthase|nr:FliI/YscN family ATPase [Gammaproteobacteria bacterium]MDB2376128.1 FliI/YscN family ATPase [Gammaproteobacteria bacterium]MDB9950089.1 FliI/YscN family ATPase [Gammaproteobacteria bacterium]MDC3361834.1 FliI/YscN family ATPase [Gammaproteobacteria bacterium]HAU82778.1 flagellum-specific ATP synthase FliI [Betaproteobacteria bacterium]